MPTSTTIDDETATPARADGAAGRRAGLSRRELLRRSGMVVAAGVAAGALRSPLAAWAEGAAASAAPGSASAGSGAAGAAVAAAAGAAGIRLAADPTDLPAPIGRRAPKHHDITLTSDEVDGEIEPGVRFSYMTFGGRIPGPMLRVRQGDTVSLTLRHGKGFMPHNIDLHAVYGPGGGAEDTLVGPGQSKTITFKALYPGAFIYHCAVGGMLDYHISAGMFGMILVEPPEGLPPVDREFYLGQHEVYTSLPTGAPGDHAFDFDKLAAEDPSYVLLNGEKYALTSGVRGAMKARVGETVRVFFVNGGPNLTSSFHPIGSVWTRAWREGGIVNTPERYLQTVQVAPGSAAVAELELPVPGEVKLVDHALSRVARKGMLGVIQVEGPDQAGIFRTGA